MKNKGLVHFFLAKVVDKSIEKCENDYRKDKAKLIAKLLSQLF